MSRGAALVLGVTLLGAAAAADEAAAPRIVDVSGPRSVPVGVVAQLRVRFLAPRGDVVAVIQVLEDLDGGLVGRGSRQRELNVLTRAFGLETGELVVPVHFASAGRKRVVLRLVTDERTESDPVTVELDAAP